MITAYDFAREIRLLTAAGWPATSMIARAEAGLTWSTFIRQLTDISRSCLFMHKVSARRCDNCGHGTGYLASPPRLQLATISGADRRGILHFCDICCDVCWI